MGSTGGWGDMGCFFDLSRFGLQANEDGVMYRRLADDTSPEVLVVQDPKPNSNGVWRRTLIFKDSKGKCNGQAGTACANITESVIGLSLAQSPDSAKDECDSKVCVPDAVKSVNLPGGAYVRSMVGALHNLLASDGNVLSIGLGAGTMALSVQNKLKGVQQTVVELSGGVVDAAKCFGASSGQSNLKIVQAEGRSFLESQSDAAYDAVLVDVFDGDDKVPPCFTTQEFFKTAQRVLKPNGLLVMNAHSGKTLHNDLKDLLPAAQAVFADVQVGGAPGLANAIVLMRGKSTETQAGGTSDKELEGWFADAQFEAAPKSNDSPLVDANVKCGAQK
jgi:SAM-dependent methyltransferase